MICKFFFSILQVVFSFLKKDLFIFCTWAFSSCGEQELFFIVVRGLLIAMASLVAEHRLQVHRFQQLLCVSSEVAVHSLQSVGSAVVAHGPGCYMAKDLSRPRIKLVSPELQGGFLTTGPPGKPCLFILHNVPDAQIFSF